MTANVERCGFTIGGHRCSEPLDHDGAHRLKDRCLIDRERFERRIADLAKTWTCITPLTCRNWTDAEVAAQVFKHCGAYILEILRDEYGR